MRYQTGDMAEIMGMTNMGIIYLEKRGIIRAERQANGYRSFGLYDVSMLGTIRSYEKMGFTLEEAITLTSLPTGKIADSLDKRRQALLEQLEMLRMAEEELSIVPTGETLTEENAQFITMPAMYYFPVWEAVYDLEELSAEVRRQMRKTDVSWLSAMPYMHYCTKAAWQNGAWRLEKGNCILVHHARAQGVEINQWVEELPPRRCLFFQDLTDDLLPALKKGTDFLDKKGIAWDGSAIVPLTLLFQDGMPQLCRAQVYIPLAEDK